MFLVSDQMARCRGRPCCSRDPTDAMIKHLMFIRIVAVLTAVVSLTDVQAQGYPPEEAARHMTLADGLQVHLVASEPMITQPVCVEFDDRGRLWVIQYLQ